MCPTVPNGWIREMLTLRGGGGAVRWLVIYCYKKLTIGVDKVKKWKNKKIK